MKIYDICPECKGTGTLPIGIGGSSPCGRCGATGKIETSIADTVIEDKIDINTSILNALQLSVDQVAEVVKESSEYIKKICEIVSKEKDK
jgi:DnaJ-class molecular chaperone